MFRDAAELVQAWLRIVDGSAAAQCAVPVDTTNAGQLAKYVTKLWELPPRRARELFDALSQRRLVEGFGSWRRWRGLGDVERVPSGWFTSQMTVAEIERMHPDELVGFGRYMKSTRAEPVYRPGAEPRPSERAATDFGVVLRARAGDIVASLRNDSSPVWKRDEQSGEPVDRARARLAELAAHRRRELAALSHPPPWYTRI